MQFCIQIRRPICGRGRNSVRVSRTCYNCTKGTKRNKPHKTRPEGKSEPRVHGNATRVGWMVLGVCVALGFDTNAPDCAPNLSKWAARRDLGAQTPGAAAPRDQHAGSRDAGERRRRGAWEPGCRGAQTPGAAVSVHLKGGGGSGMVVRLEVLCVAQTMMVWWSGRMEPAVGPPPPPFKFRMPDQHPHVF